MTARTNIGVRPTSAPNVDFGAIAQRNVQNALAQDQIRKQEELARQERINKMAEEFELQPEDFVLDSHKFRNTGDAATEAISQLRDLYYKNMKMLRSNPESFEVKQRLDNIRQSVKKIRMENDKFVEASQKGLKMIEEDKMSGVSEDDWATAAESHVKGRLRIKIDPSTIAMKTLVYDENGQIANVIPFDDAVRLNPVEKIDIPTTLDTMVDTIGRTLEQERVGMDITSVDEFGQRQEEFVSREVDAMLGTDEKSLQNNEVLADLGHQFFGWKQRNFTPGQRNMIRDELKSRIKGRYDEKYMLKGSTARNRNGGSGNSENKPKVFAATANGKPAIDKKGNFLFNLDRDYEVEYQGEPLIVTNLKGSRNGTLSLTGFIKRKKREKTSGKPNKVTSFREVKEQTPNGLVVYELIPTELTYDKGENEPSIRQAVNTLAGYMDLGNEDSMRNAMYQSFIKQFGQEAANRYFAPLGADDLANQGGDLDPLGLFSEEELKAIKQKASNTKVDNDPLGLFEE